MSRPPHATINGGRAIYDIQRTAQKETHQKAIFTIQRNAIDIFLLYGSFLTRGEGPHSRRVHTPSRDSREALITVSHTLFHLFSRSIPVRRGIGFFFSLPFLALKMRADFG